MKKQLALLILCLIGIQMRAQTTVSIRLNAGDEDLYVDNYNTTGNYPNEDDYCSGAWTIGGVPAVYRNFFKFDMSAIPAGATINSAYLSLYYANPNEFNDTHSSLTNSNESVLQRVTTPWSEATMNWTTQSAVSSNDQVILPQSTSPTQDYPNMDVTAMVQTMVDSGNYGFSLRLVSEIAYARMLFASGDHPDSLQHPLLVINYTLPIVCIERRLMPDGEDASIDDYHPAQNNPNELEYFGGTWTIQGDTTIWRNLFKFDISAIPSNSIIQSANLSLYFAAQSSFPGANDTSLSSSNACVIQRVTSPWTESTVTWNNQPSVSSNNSVTIGPSVSGAEDFPNIDVTALVQDMVNDPTNSYGFRLSQAFEQAYGRMLFASGDNPDTSRLPKLQVCYVGTDGINDLSSNDHISIYPNPANSELNIKWSPEENYTSITICDALGQIIHSENCSRYKSSTINVSNWSRGVYFLTLLKADGRVTKRVVVAK
ncbi:MAG: DNRLRE domain-containing protein [Bacteroidetes bacterium]|nr:DNRLRE domain-containing protein [Bacteroidota bacterium]